MPKIKTHSGAKKRFKLSANGKLMRSQAGRGHFMRLKSNKQSRQSREIVASEAGQVANIKKYMLIV